MSSVVLFDIFLVSWAGMVVILSRHVNEVRNGHPKRVKDGLSEMAAPIISIGDRAATTTIRGVTAIYYKVVLAVLSRFTPWFERFSDKIVSRSTRFTDTIRGKGVLKNGGNASPFLKDIKLHKEQNGGHQGL